MLKKARIRLRIATQLYSVIGIGAIGMMILAGTALVGAKRMAEDGRALYEVGLAGLTQSSQVELEFERLRGLVARAPAELDLERQAGYRNSFTERLAQLNGDLAGAREAATGPNAEILAAIIAAFDQVGQIGDQVFDFAASFAQDQANELIGGPFAAADEQLSGLLRELVEVSEARANAELDRLSTAESTLRFATIAISLAAVLIAAGIGFFVANRISRRVVGLTQTMGALAKNDTTVTIPATGSQDELGELTMHFNLMAQALADTETKRRQLIANGVFNSWETSAI